MNYVDCGWDLEKQKDLLGELPYLLLREQIIVCDRHIIWYAVHLKRRPQATVLFIE